MIGLMKKDLYCLKQYFRQYILMVLFFAVFGFFMKSPSYVIFMSMIMGVSLMFSTLSVDEMGGFGFSLTLPVNRRQIVGSKYLLLIVGMAGILLCSMGLGLIIAVAAGVSYSEVFFCTVSCGGFYLLVMAIVIPVAFRWKVEKARIVLLGIIALPAIVVILIFRQMNEVQKELFEQMVEMNLSTIVIVLGIIAIIAILFSYLISTRTFEREEF